MGEIRIKRIYDPPESGDGRRVLVDRIWPRGVTKETAKLSVWLRQIAPSDELRKWFSHDLDKFADFARLYLAEIEKDEERTSCLSALREWAEHETVTLVYGAKDEEHNQAVVLQRLLQNI